MLKVTITASYDLWLGGDTNRCPSYNARSRAHGHGMILPVLPGACAACRRLVAPKLALVLVAISGPQRGFKLGAPTYTFLILLVLHHSPWCCIIHHGVASSTMVLQYSPWCCIIQHGVAIFQFSMALHHSPARRWSVISHVGQIIIIYRSSRTSRS